MSTLHDTFPEGPSAQAPFVLPSLLSPPLAHNSPCRCSAACSVSTSIIFSC